MFKSNFFLLILLGFLMLSINNFAQDDEEEFTLKKTESQKELQKEQKYLNFLALFLRCTN